MCTTSQGDSLFALAYLRHEPYGRYTYGRYPYATLMAFTLCYTYLRHEPKVEQRHAAIGQREQVTLVRVAMDESV